MTGPYKGVHVAPGLWSIHLASTLFTINVGHWSQVSSSGHLWSPQPGDAAKKMNVACHSLISSPDTVNFVANLPSLLPDVVTCRHVFIIANSYRRLAGKIIPLPRSSRNLQGDCCLTFMATDFVSTLDLRCQCWNADLKKKWGDLTVPYGRFPSLNLPISLLLTDKSVEICLVLPPGKSFTHYCGVWIFHRVPDCLHARWESSY